MGIQRCAYTFTATLAFFCLSGSPSSGRENVRQLVHDTSLGEKYATIKSTITALREESLKESPNASALQLCANQIDRCAAIALMLDKTCPTASEAPCLKDLLLSALRQERDRTFARQQLTQPLTEHLWHHLIKSDLDQKVEVQNFVIDLLLNMVIISGGQFAEQLITGEYKAQQAKLTSKIRDLQEAFKDTQTRIGQKSKEVIQTLDQTFITQLRHIKDTEGETQSRFAQEVAYIQRLINLNIPPSRLIVNAITSDLFFAAGAMTTPANGYTWYNIFPNNNWIFDTSTATFVHQGQLGALPATVQFGLKKNWHDPNATNLSGPTTSENGALNHIFTEYFTAQAAYQIQVELTLINVTYPFCAAILCNKARWLSGSLDRMNSYRMVGLYGTQKGDTPQIGLYAGQTTFLEIGTVPIATSPLNPIFSGTSQPLYTLTQSDVQQISKDPLVFRITIITQETSLNVTLEKQTATGWKTLTSSPASNFNVQDNALLFWYHGIGFMAPGCQASFKIIQPKEVAYTSQQLATFSDQQKKGKP